MARIGRGIQQQAFVTPAVADNGDGTYVGLGQGRNIGPFAPGDVTQPPKPPVVSTLSVEYLSVAQRTNRFHPARKTHSLLAGPVVIQPLPSQAQTTWNYGTTFAVDLLRRRFTAVKRFPLQGWDGAPTTVAQVILQEQSNAALPIATSGALYAQSFIAHNSQLVGVSIDMIQVGNPVDQVTFSIRSDSAGAPGAIIVSTTFRPNVSSVVHTPINIPNLQCVLTPGTTYWLTLARTGATDASNSFDWWEYAGGPSGPFSEGLLSQAGVPVATTDMVFRLYFTSQTLSLASRLLGPKPPLVITVPPVFPVKINTPLNALSRRITERRRAPKSELFPPATLAQPPPPPVPIQTELVAVRRSTLRTRLFPLPGFEGIQGIGSGGGSIVQSAPSTPTLDNTTRADENPLSNGGKWTNKINTATDANLQLSSNAIRNTNIFASFNTAWWNADGPFTDSEVWGTITALGPNVDAEVGFFVRVSNPGTATPTGYHVAVSGTNNHNWVRIQSFSGGSFTTLATLTPNPFGNGDHIWVFVTGSHIRVFHSPDGINWDQILDAIDGTYQSGFVGIRCGPNGSERLTVIGGGSVTPPPPVTGLSAFNPNLGVRRPAVIDPLPTLEMQTVSVVNQAVRPRRNTEQRRFPIQGWLHDEIDVGDPGGLFTGDIFTFGASSKFLGVRKPKKVKGVYTAQPIVNETFTARYRRQNEARLSRPQWLTPAVICFSDGGSPLAGFSRGIGPFPPRVVGRVPTQDQQTIRVTLTRIRPRPKLVRTRRPTVTFDALIVEPIRVVLAPSLARRPKTRSVLPQTIVSAVTQTFSGPRVTLTKRRPVGGSGALAPPLIINPLPSQRAQTIQATFAPQTRRSLVRTFYTRPVISPVVQTFAGPRVETVAIPRSRPPKTMARQRRPVVVFDALIVGPVNVTNVQTRPRKTRSFLSPPATLVTSGFLAAPLTTKTVRTRPRKTVSRLSPPVFYPQTSEISVVQVRIRPRPTTHDIFPPTTLQEFFGPVEFEVAVRIPLEDKRRLSHYFLRPPQVIRIPSVEQRQQTVQVELVRTRPRKTGFFLKPPTVVRVPSVEQTEQTIRVTLARTRPRPTTRRLAPPAVIITNPPVVTTILVSLATVRTRVEQKRHFPLPGQRQRLVLETGSTVTCQMRDPLLGVRPPQIINPLPNQKQQTISVQLVRTRPRKTTNLLRKPTVLQTFSGPEVFLTRIRPRPTSKELFPPTTLKVFSGPEVTLTHTRPRPTSKFVKPPTVVRTPSIEQAERTIRVTLARIRPRPTTRLLPEIPVVVQFVAPPVRVTCNAVNRRLEGVRRVSRYQLGEPTVLQVFAGPKVALVETRPRPTVRRLVPPVVVVVPAVQQAQQTIKVVLVRIRPRPQRALVLPPTVIEPQQPIQPPVEVTLAGRTRGEEQRRAPHYKLGKPFRVFGKPLEIRVDGPPVSGWTTYRMVSGWDPDEPVEGFGVGKPEAGWDSDTPETGWEAGKPK